MQEFPEFPGKQTPGGGRALPFGEEVPGGVQQEEHLLLRLAAVARVQEVLQRHGSLGCADDVDVFLLDAPGQCIF